MKVLFLDIDGVLNHPGCYTGQSARIDQYCAQQLNRILAETDCKIVLTSGWRYHIINGEMTILGFAAMLRTHGIESRSALIDHVGDSKGGESDMNDQLGRGERILKWLAKHPEVERSVALDDTHFGYTSPLISLVLTDATVGLRRADADKAIAILNGTED